RSNEPKFELDHLATFAAGTRNGVIHAEDGLRKLRQMENTTGIWTMRCMLIVERGNLVILDNSTAVSGARETDWMIHYRQFLFSFPCQQLLNHCFDDIEKFVAYHHILFCFPCQQLLNHCFDDIEKFVAYHHILFCFPCQQLLNHCFDDIEKFVAYHHILFCFPCQQLLNHCFDDIEKFVAYHHILFCFPCQQLLNHCFDDIEKFVARLQQAAESYKELERRKRDRGAKNKKRQSGDGMLNARARPPPDRDFVDIFQKFKLSFNLLAKLKAHIHDPNAPELVHFLFTPLSLIYEASRDPFHGNQNLGDQAVAPVLTADAKQLLNNCLTTKEVELWQALGKHWTTSRDEWMGPIPPYVPEFYDGWQPAAPLLEDMTVRSFLSHPVHENPPRGFGHGPPRPMPFPDEDRPPLRMDDDFDRSESNSHAGFEPMPGPSGLSPRLHRRAPPSGHHFVTEIVEKPHPESNITRAIVEPKVDDNAAYFEELRSMGNVLIYEAAHERTGKNEKELTVQKGDILQVLDNSRNWWKLRNHKGQVGFAPYTILKAVKTDLEHYPPHSDRGLTNGGGLPPMSYRSDNYIDDNSSRRGVSRRDTPNVHEGGPTSH
ncbi:hypothetical protein EGW08_018849, partial [Elysia chlorotica]